LERVHGPIMPAPETCTLPAVSNCSKRPPIRSPRWRAQESPSRSSMVCATPCAISGHVRRRHGNVIRYHQRITPMACEPTSVSPLGDKPNASRRGFVAAAATMAAAGAACAGGVAQAQTALDVRIQNPPGMAKLPSSSHVVEVTGPHRTVYLAGQTGVDASGKVAEGFRAQAVQVFENIKTALAAVGGGFEHIVKLNKLYHQYRGERTGVSRGAQLLFPEQVGSPPLYPGGGGAPFKPGLSS